MIKSLVTSSALIKNDKKFGHLLSPHRLNVWNGNRTRSGSEWVLVHPQFHLDKDYVGDDYDDDANDTDDDVDDQDNGGKFSASF